MFLYKLVARPSWLLAITLCFFAHCFAHQGKKQQKFFIVIESTADFAAALTGDFFQQLTQKGTLFTNYSAVAHPSFPNYLALTAGNTFGITSDIPAPDIDVPNLVDLLEAKGVCWKLYIENLPSNCYTGQVGSEFPSGTSGFTLPAAPTCSAAAYVRFHNPFINYVNIATNPVRCAKIVDAAQFFEDVKNNAVPDFAFYIPNTFNDNYYLQLDINPTLASPVAYSDRMLRYFFTQPLANKNFLKDRVFAVIFDQSATNTSGNQVYAVFVGCNVLANNKVNTPYNHYSLLRTIEDNFDLLTLGQNDATASPMVGWRK